MPVPPSSQKIFAMQIFFGSPIFSQGAFQNSSGKPKLFSFTPAAPSSQKIFAPQIFFGSPSRTIYPPPLTAPYLHGTRPKGMSTAHPFGFHAGPSFFPKNLCYANLFGSPIFSQGAFQNSSGLPPSVIPNGKSARHSARALACEESPHFFTCRGIPHAQMRASQNARICGSG